MFKNSSDLGIVVVVVSVVSLTESAGCVPVGADGEMSFWEFLWGLYFNFVGISAHCGWYHYLDGILDFMEKAR